MTSEAALGPFVLGQRIGHGGMSDVWRAHHQPTGVPVALKVLTAARARTASARARFAGEVSAVAALRHPNIVMVYDTGDIPEEVEERLDGALVAGSPYMAIEIASGGTLAEADLDWYDASDALQGLLSALSHAHAHGIVHLDIKPANLLRCTVDDLRPGWKLADFGIAYAVAGEKDGEAPRVAGTPRYMAPEQVAGRWRDFGPWTDLYALGCVAWELVTGGPPFQVRDKEALRAAHLVLEPPPLRPVIPIPTRFEGWVMRLLQKDPSARFRSAAEAAMALSELGDPSVAIPVLGLPAPGRPLPEDTFDMDDMVGAQRIVEARSEPRAQRSQRIELLSRVRAPMVPPVPPLSEVGREDRGVLDGVGMSLYGLRTVPLVGRRTEKAALWTLLSDTAESGRPRALLLRGPTGVGKSRLAHWLSVSAQESGVAIGMSAKYGEMVGPRHGLSGMVARVLGCVGLAASESMARVERILRGHGINDPYEWEALTDVMVPDRATRVLASPSQRYAVIARLISRLADDRLAVVWLDDVHHGLDALEFVTHLMDTAPGRCPILVVLTASTAGLAAAPDVCERLEGLVRQGSLLEVEVPPLPDEQHHRLVRELGLDGLLAAQVERATAGNPMFAVQLVGDMMTRDLLRPARRDEAGRQIDSGFLLRRGATLELPDDLDAVWRARLEQVLGGRPAATGIALELAAALGDLVVEREWHGVCGLAGVPIPTELVADLARAGLVQRRAGQSWAFTHPMIRRTAIRRAEEGGRWEAHNLHCARWFEEHTEGAPGRRALHLLAGGRHASAVDDLLQSLRELANRGEFGRCRLLLAERERALTALDVPTRDIRWAHGWIHRAEVERMTGESSLAERWYQRVVDGSEEGGPSWKALVPVAWLGLADIWRARGEPGQCEEFLRRTAEHYEAEADLGGLVQCRIRQGMQRVLRGQLEEGEALAAEALTHVGEDDLVVRAACHRVIGIACVQRGDVQRAARELGAARELYHRAGSVWGVATGYTDQAKIAQARGDLGAALAAHRAAYRVLRTLGSRDAVLVQVSVAAVQVLRREFAAAAQSLESVLGRREAIDRPALMCFVHAVQAALAAAVHEWDGVYTHLQQTGALLDKTGELDEDLARLTTLTAELARSQDRDDLASMAQAIALRVRTALGREPDTPDGGSAGI